MELTIHQRLKKFIEYKELSNAKFGEPFKASRQEVNNWCVGTKMSVYRIGEMLDEYPQLNGHWFLTGNGNMINGGVTPIENINVCRKTDCISEKEKLRNKIDELNAMIIELQKEKYELLRRRL